MILVITTAYFGATLGLLERDIKNYDSVEDKIQECRQKINDLEKWLDDIIDAESKISGYDYSKLLESISYRNLFKTYLKDKYDLVYPTLKKIDGYKEQIEYLESQHLSIEYKRWLYNFSH